MIRITRPTEAPEVLLEEGDKETQSMCQEYDDNHSHYQSGERKLEFDRKIYADESVKEALKTAQHEKCCYCETKFGATSYGAVEHFRPKGEMRQKKGAGRLLPGYYWLAFNWENLLVICEKCNTNKGSLFPLEDPDARARSHHDDLSRETPLLVDPGSEDPRKHIRFRGAAVEPITRKGRETISVTGLRRSELEEKRKERLDMVEALATIPTIGGEKSGAEKAGEIIERWKSEKAEFSSMTRAFLDDMGAR